MRGFSLVVVLGLLDVVTSLVERHELQGARASEVVAHEFQLFCNMRHLPRPRIEPTCPALAGKFFLNH